MTDTQGICIKGQQGMRQVYNPLAEFRIPPVYMCVTAEFSAVTGKNCRTKKSCIANSIGSTQQEAHFKVSLIKH